LRLERYITEEYLSEEFDVDQVLELVEKNCSDIFNVMKTNHNALWRGVDREPSSNITEMVPRTDRRPRDTKMWLHTRLDDAFKAKFGWRVRSEGTFATASMNFADQFGSPHMFFPFDGYKYVWNPNVHDLTAKLISFNYDLDNLPENVLKSFAADEYLKVSKPNFKTGVGNGYWSLEKGAAEVDDIEGIVKYYNDWNTACEIRHTSTKGPVRVAGSEHIVEYEVEGSTKYAYWIPQVSGSDREKIVKVARKEMEEGANKRIKKMISEYTDKDINKAMYEMGEISFKCEKYYIVHERMWGRLFVDHIRGHR